MIILYKGRRGCGKTLSLVRDAFDFFKKGWNVLTNIKLSFGRLVDSEFILNLSRDSNLSDTCLVVDEIEVFFDSRSWNRESQKKFSYFLQQIRKRNIVILCTCQYTNLVDLRLRQQIDVVACPDFKKDNPFCKVVYIDVTSLESSPSPTSLIEVFDSRLYFPMYDTFEMVV
jgi:hypothetical protein